MIDPLHKLYYFVFNKMLEFVVPVFIGLKATPNQVTILRFLLLIPLSAFLFTLNNYFANIIALILYHSFIFLDYVDGKLARIRNMSTKLGEILDVVVDYSGHILIIIGITLSLISSEGIFQIGSLQIKIPVELLPICGVLNIAGMLFTLIINLKYKESRDSIARSMKRLRAKRHSDAKEPEYESARDLFYKNIIIPNNFPFSIIFKIGTLLSLSVFVNLIFIPFLIFSFTYNIRAVIMLYYYKKINQ